ncbi:MoxR family ATPase [Porticoccus sp. W117]|uniref:AAA family ATPase n=1 Tax=Porticoccus sp. W117 TaxID=3054777 RepID=UPI0025937B03|nr:MoxR family ATPase [Porticoccus sp. W117]MDM3871092.1 MoxR family ATPase [Porticoccus sp. W117]
MECTPSSGSPDLQQPLADLRQWLNSQIVGQSHLNERLLIALLADGHLLVEGAPGLAKTRAIKTLADGIEGDFHRIQFTPDLLPADITGSDIYRHQEGSFQFQPGPIFHNLVLADEINRAPAKVQSALLEAMAERQISVGRKTYSLPKLFLVMATQNPIEQEGTYPLPEAQMDRFLMHVMVDYPAPEAEREILRITRGEALEETQPQPQVVSEDNLLAARKQVAALHMSEQVEEYLIQLVLATRQPDAYSKEQGSDIGDWLEYGASPRATIALDRCARAHAWLQGRDYVSPDDVRSVAHDVLRHRLILSFESEARGIDANQVIDKLLEVVPSA